MGAPSDTLIIAVCGSLAPTIAVCGSLAPTLAVVVNAIITHRIARRLVTVAEATHTLVNSQNSIMRRLVASLSRRIATQNPQDEAAQLAAISAEEDAAKCP
jgi:hypothetical protein